MQMSESEPEKEERPEPRSGQYHDANGAVVDENGYSRGYW